MECLNSETPKSPINYEQLRKKVDDVIDKRKGKSLFFFLFVFRNPKSIIRPKSIIKRWKDIQDVDLNFRSETIKECKYIQKVAEIRSKYYPPFYAIAIFIFAQAFTLLYLISKEDSYQFLKIIIILLVFIVGVLILYKADKLFTRCNSIIENTEKRILSEDSNPHENVDITNKIQT